MNLLRKSCYLQKTTKNALKRKYLDPLEATEDGQAFKSFKASDRIVPYFADKAKLLSDRELVNNLLNNGIIKNMTPNMAKSKGYIQFVSEHLPSEYMRNPATGELLLDKNNNPILDESRYYIPKTLSGKLRAITDTPVDLAKIHPLLDKAQKIQDILKTAKLSFSLFHDKAMALVYEYQNICKPGKTFDIMKFYTNANHYLEGPEFRNNERLFISRAGITTHVQSNADIIQNISKNLPELRKVVNTPVFKQILQANDIRGNFLFGKFQRILKVNDFTNKRIDWISKHPNATPEQITKAEFQIARQINSAYGGLNWEALGRTPLFRSIARFLLLAPDWTYSNFDFFAQAFNKGAGGNISRIHIATSIIAGGIFTELMNYAINGHFTDTNKKGHEFEVQLPNGQYLSTFPGQSGDAIKLYSRIANNGVMGVSEFAQGKANAIPQAGIIAGTGRNYFGQNIVSNGLFGKGKHLNAFQKSGNYLSGALQPFNPNPISLNSGITLYNNGERNPLMFMPAITGLTTVKSKKKY